MPRISYIAGVATAALLLSPAAHASTQSISTTVTAVSEYAFRGIAQSDEHPAVQGAVDYTLALDKGVGYYAGLWASNVDFNDNWEAKAEVDIYSGVTYTLDKWAFDGGFIYYAYPGADTTRDYDYLEFKAQVGYDFGFASLALTYLYSPDFYLESDEAGYTQVALTVPVTAVEGLKLLGSFGHQYVQNNAVFGLPDYNTWSLGFTYDLPFGKSFPASTFGLQYTDTDLSRGECVDGCEARVIASFSVKF